jgi:DNA repair protein RecO (recombination protein O)
MEWHDTGFVLAGRRHGESALIIELLTREHGRHAGLVRGGQSPRIRAVLQPGNQVAASWRGRLAEHLGTMVCELARANAAHLIDDPDRLAGLSAAAALVAAALPEREPHPDVFASFGELVQALDSTAEWRAHYIGWERDLLSALGFGLDLSRCAVTGIASDLAYVSPRTGCAVSRAAGLPYHDRLLPLPSFLLHRGVAEGDQVAQGMALTGHFLLHHVFAPQGRALPAARSRLAERICREVAPARRW